MGSAREARPQDVAMFSQRTPSPRTCVYCKWMSHPGSSFRKSSYITGFFSRKLRPAPPGPINAPVKSELLTTSLSLMLPEALGRGSESSPREAWGFGLWLPHRRLLSLPPRASGLLPGAAQGSAGAALRRSSAPSLAPGCISSCCSALGTDSPVRLCT